MNTVANVTLNSGTTMPQLGFGVFKVPPAEAEQTVILALQAGYRSIDTAAMYANEDGVGRALATSGIARDELFITTKLNNDAHGFDQTRRAFDTSLDELGLDYVDLYLIHWPQPKLDRYVDSWRAMQTFAADGRARAIGVSNFQTEHLQRLLDETDTVPAINQVELHPYLVQAELRAFDQAHGIVTEAWSPLARGGSLLADPTLVELGQKYGRSPAQIAIRWHLQIGNVVIPKSTTPARIVENIDVQDFELSPADVDAITALDRGERIGSHPDQVNGPKPAVQK